MDHKKTIWKQVLPSVLWTLAGIALCILLVSAVQRNNKLRCKNFEIEIAGFKNEMFINEADVQAIVEENLGHKIKACSIDQLDLRKLETALQKDSWINKAQLYVDNSQVLHINVSERLPVARIFTVANRSFYIDSEAVALPLSNYEVADVPVFTNVPDRGKVVAPVDSILWRQLSRIGSYILRDSFLLMQVGQVNITPEREMELYPVIGNHVVRFGALDNYQLKFEKLSKFYKQVLARAGLNKYSVVDLRFDKQVVARLKDAGEIIPAEPQINILDDRTADVVVEEPEQAPPVIAKKEIRVEKKKTEVQVAAKPKKEKEKPKQQTAKVEKNKQVKKTEKIVVASNSKPDQKTIKQLPKKADKPGLIEIDIRLKKEPENKSNAKALMPKKQ